MRAGRYGYIIHFVSRMRGERSGSCHGAEPASKSNTRPPRALLRPGSQRARIALWLGRSGAKQKQFGRLSSQSLSFREILVCEIASHLNYSGVCVCVCVCVRGYLHVIDFEKLLNNAEGLLVQILL